MSKFSYLLFLALAIGICAIPPNIFDKISLAYYAVMILVGIYAVIRYLDDI